MIRLTELLTQYLDKGKKFVTIILNLDMEKSYDRL
jgi:hypothetical protein